MMNVLHSFDAGYIAHFFDKKNVKCEILNKKSTKTQYYTRQKFVKCYIFLQPGTSPSFWSKKTQNVRFCILKKMKSFKSKHPSYTVLFLLKKTTNLIANFKAQNELNLSAKNKCICTILEVNVWKMYSFYRTTVKFVVFLSKKRTVYQACFDLKLFIFLRMQNLTFCVFLLQKDGDVPGCKKI